MRITSGGELLINTTTDAGDYKLQVNGNGLFSNSGETILRIQDLDGTNQYLEAAHNGGGSYFISRHGSNHGSYTWYSSNGSVTTRMTLSTGGNLELPTGSIKTAAPSAGTAKPWKLGEAGVTLGGSNTSGVRVEIDGVVYYLVTGYLP